MRMVVIGGVRTFVSNFEKEVLDRLQREGRLRRKALDEGEALIAADLVRRDVLGRYEDGDGIYYKMKEHENDPKQL